MDVAGEHSIMFFAQLGGHSWILCNVVEDVLYGSGRVAIIGREKGTQL